MRRLDDLVAYYMLGGAPRRGLLGRGFAHPAYIIAAAQVDNQ